MTSAGIGSKSVFHTNLSTVCRPGSPRAVFQNLLNNACRYTEPIGTESVIVERKGDDAMVLVRDTRIGIPSDRLADVFEIFSQVHSEEIRMQGGLGIGLALVKRLVEMHKGTVEARAKVSVKEPSL